MPLSPGILSPLIPGSVLLASVFATGSLRTDSIGWVPTPSVVTARLPIILAALRLLVAWETIRRVNRALNTLAANSWRLTVSQGWNWSKEIAVVTGGGGGIGMNVAIKLAEAGVRVAVLDVKDAPQSFEGNVLIHYHKCDVSDTSAVAEVANTIRKELGHPTILVNNAGICAYKTILDTPESYVHRIFGVNAVAHFLTTKQFLPHMIKSDKGHIVTVASLASFVSLARAADYSGTKAAALAFHEALRSELKFFYNAPNVMTTAVHTNWVDTPILNGIEDFIKSEGIRPLSSVFVADRIVKQILSKTGGQIILPESDALVAKLPGFPLWMQELIRDTYGRRATKVKL